MAERILIIEDERLLSRTLVEVLQRAHYSAFPTYSGREGFACLQKHSYDLVIVDLKLPDMDGLDLLSRIQTALLDVQVLILIKPFQPDKILKLIPGLLNPRYPKRQARSHLSYISQPKLSYFDPNWAY